MSVVDILTATTSAVSLLHYAFLFVTESPSILSATAGEKSACSDPLQGSHEEDPLGPTTTLRQLAGCVAHEARSRFVHCARAGGASGCAVRESSAKLEELEQEELLVVSTLRLLAAEAAGPPYTKNHPRPGGEQEPPRPGGAHWKYSRGSLRYDPYLREPREYFKLCVLHQIQL